MRNGSGLFLTSLATLELLESYDFGLFAPMCTMT